MAIWTRKVSQVVISIITCIEGGSKQFVLSEHIRRYIYNIYRFLNQNQNYNKNTSEYQQMGGFWKYAI